MTENLPPDLDWVDKLPKLELHLHLEGAIPLPCLWELLQKYGGDPLVPDLPALDRMFTFRDFPHFLETWSWKNDYLREYADFSFFAEGVARDLASQNIRYAEAFYSPSDFRHHGLLPQELTRAIRKGLDRVPGIEIALIADVVRDSPLEMAAATLAAVNEVKNLGVIGIGLGGSEQLFPPEPFADLFARARDLGFHTTAHAGEAAGAESIRGALHALQAERIGHATRAFEDPLLMEELRERQVPLEMCPLSNIRTGVVGSIQQHPIRRYFEQGLLVTVNTDDPKMFGNSLAGEYRMLVGQLGFSPADIRTLIRNAIRASWMPEERKQSFLAEVL